MCVRISAALEVCHMLDTIQCSFYFHCVPIKHQFLLPTPKTQKRSIDAPQERRPGAAPQPHSRRSHWSGPPSALSPSHHTLQSSPQGRPSRPENTCETHSKGTKLKHKQTNPIKSEIRSKLLLQASNLAKNGATPAPLQESIISVENSHKTEPLFFKQVK